MMCVILENKEKNMNKYQDDFKSIFSNCENQEAAYILLKTMQQQLIEEYKSSLIEKYLQNQEPKSKSSQFAIHLPEQFRKAINEKNFNSPLAQEFLSYMHSAIEDGKVSVLPRKYAQNAVDAGVTIRPEDFFVYVANGMENLYEVRQNLVKINLKHHRIARQATQNKKSVPKKKAKNVAKPVTSKKSKKVLVINLPKKIKQAMKEQNCTNPEMQEYLSYLYNAMENGSIKVVQRQDKKEIKRNHIKLSNNDAFFFVAKDGDTYYQIAYELGEIRKKYKNLEQTVSAEHQTTSKKPVERIGGREEFYPFTKYVMVSKPAEAEIKEKQVEKMPAKLSRKKSLKVKDKTVCMGDDGTIFYPFN